MNRRQAALALGACLAALATPAFSAADGSQLQLPDGVDVAIVVFEDLQCPDCRRSHPILVEAARATGVPLIVHDYPIPRHDWAFPAAVLARYFTQQSQALGTEFRNFIFDNQPGIGVANLREFGERFATTHGQQLPGDVDPDGRLAAERGPSRSSRPATSLRQWQARRAAADRPGLRPARVAPSAPRRRAARRPR